MWHVISSIAWCRWGDSYDNTLAETIIGLFKKVTRWASPHQSALTYGNAVETPCNQDAPGFTCIRVKQEHQDILYIPALSTYP